MMDKIFIPCFLLGCFFVQTLHVNARLLPDEGPLLVDSNFTSQLTQRYNNCKIIQEKEKSEKIDMKMIPLENEVLRGIISVGRTKEKGYLCSPIYRKKVPDFCHQADSNKIQCIDEKWKKIQSNYIDFRKKIHKFSGFTRDKTVLEQYKTLEENLETARKDIIDFCIQQSGKFLDGLFYELKEEFDRCINHHETVSTESIPEPNFMDWLLPEES